MAEKEYIEREAAIATVCKGCNKDFPNEPCEPADCAIQQGLFKIPAADVAKVVRCKDCRHCERGVCYHPEQRYLIVYAGHYCGYGKRKMDGKGEGE